MTVYLAHATSFCGAVWAPVIEELEEVETSTWDFAGHGSGPELQLPVDWRRFGSQVLDETERGGVGVGHSMGGAAIAMAQIADPERFRAIVLIEPVIYPGPHVRVEHFLSAIAAKRKASFVSREVARANFTSRAAFASWDSRALDGYLRCGLKGDDPVVLACDPEVEADIYRASNDHDTWEHLSEIQVPVLIITGADSDTIPPENARAMAAQMPQAGLEIVEDAGHFIAMERPGLIAQRIRRLALAVQDSAL